MITSSSSNLAIEESGIFKVDTTKAAASARCVLIGAKSRTPSGSKKSLRGNTFVSRLLLLKDPSQSVLDDCACKVVLVFSSSLRLLLDDSAVFGVDEGIDALSFLFLFRGGVKDDCIISSSLKQRIDNLGTVSVFTEVNKGVEQSFFFFFKLLPLDDLWHVFNNLRDFDAFFICLVPCLLCFK